MLNKIQIIGRLGQDPETRFMPDGTACTNLSVATSESWKDKATGEKKEATEWHRVSLFGRVAEVAGEYLKKGDLAYFEGKIRTRKWQDKEGNDRYTTEILASELKMLTPKGERQSGGDQGGDAETYNQRAAQRNGGGYGSQGTQQQTRPSDNSYAARRSGPTPSQIERTAASTAARKPAAAGTAFDDMDDDIPF